MVLLTSSPSLLSFFLFIIRPSSPVVSQGLAFAGLVLFHYSDLSSVPPSREASPNGSL